MCKINNCRNARLTLMDLRTRSTSSFTAAPTSQPVTKCNKVALAFHQLPSAAVRTDCPAPPFGRPNPKITAMNQGGYDYSSPASPLPRFTTAPLPSQPRLLALDAFALLSINLEESSFSGPWMAEIVACW
jgi:hypothetical protein